MPVTPKPLAFDWDKGNIDKNWEKHRVSNSEAQEAFNNPKPYIFYDEKHSQDEDRWGLFGTTSKGRNLAVTFTIRDNKVRIISARDMSRKERKFYEQFQAKQKT